MMQIRAACQTVGQNQEIMRLATNDFALGERGVSSYEPKITFLAVQKRHKTRFFPENPRDGVGKVIKFSRFPFTACVVLHE
jgi:hypothetical protein